jgi:hypothetical protein
MSEYRVSDDGMSDVCLLSDPSPYLKDVIGASAIESNAGWLAVDSIFTGYGPDASSYMLCCSERSASLKLELRRSLRCLAKTYLTA